MKFFRNQTGDTIVEVMIALVVLSTVLTSVFVLTSHSQHNLQDSSEHDQALQLAQSQIEFLRGNNALDTTANSCFNAGGQAQPSGSSNCNFAPSAAAACVASDPFCYKVTIDKLPNPAASPTDQATYRVTITWDKIGGGVSSLRLVYRPPSVPPDATDVVVDDLEGDVTDADNVVADLAHGGCELVGTCGLAGRLSYNIQFHFISTTLNPSAIDHCTWVWGDGTQNTYSSSQPACKQGGAIHHNYPDIPGYATGTACTIGDAKPGRKTYTARLDVFTADGTKISSSTMNAYVYYCAKA